MTRQTRQKDLIERVFSRGRGVCVRDVCVRVLFREERLGNPSFSFVCGKKTLPLAVHRNTMRRRMRESVRKKRGNVLAGADIVVLFRGKRPIAYAETDACVEEVFQRAGLFKKS